MSLPSFRLRLRRLVLLVGVIMLAPVLGAAPLSAFALAPASLGVVVNAEDPLSVTLADAYVAARGIPPANRVEVRLPEPRNGIGRVRFSSLRTQVKEALPPGVQALLIVWVKPWRVECMSITTAFAAGFDEGWCAEPCAPTRRSPYFDSDSTKPADDLEIMPTMLLAANVESEGRALIRRGTVADGSYPSGVGYLVETSDRRRNVRAGGFPGLVAQWRGQLSLRYIRDEAVRNREDVLFYFTGTPQVPDLETNQFLPGAIADHLTSGGGRLLGGKQMSVLRWLEAGATGSYGTVVEPCNYPQKFPDPQVVIRRYRAGETLLEAYWKSVRMPGQGVFVGEPLARPFGRSESEG
jgi:uncharacterized protein (TIGR03790 family)